MPWNPNFAAILMPISGCGFSGVNMWLLIAHLNLSPGIANARPAVAATPTRAPTNSRLFNMGTSALQDSAKALCHR